MVAKLVAQGQRMPAAAMAAWTLAILLAVLPVPATAAGSNDAYPAASRQDAAADPEFVELMRRGEEFLGDGLFPDAVDVFRDALERYPDHERAAAQLGQAQMFAGLTQEARGTFTRLAAGHPESPAGPYGRGQLSLQEGDLDDARDAFLEAIRRRDEHYGAWYHLGVVEERFGRPGDAVTALERAVEINPEVRVAPLTLARIRMSTGDPERALDGLRDLRRRWPDDAEVLTVIGVAAIRAGRWDEARESLETAAGLEPGRVDTWFNLATVRMRDGRIEEAESMLRDILGAVPNHCDVRLTLARLLERTGRLPESTELLENGTAVAAPNCDFRGPLALALAANPDTRGRAIEILTELVREDPLDDASRAALGAVLEVDGRLAEALGHVETLAVTNPEDPGLHERVGALRRRTGDLEGARSALQRAIALEPAATDAHFELALVELQLDRFFEAADRLTRIIYTEPFRSEAYLRLSEALESLGETDRARASFEQYQVLREVEGAFLDIRARLAADPEDAGAYLDLGRVFAGIGFEEQARRALDQALRLDPSSADAQEMLRLLDEGGEQQGGPER